MRLALSAEPVGWALPIMNSMVAGARYDLGQQRPTSNAQAVGRKRNGYRGCRGRVTFN